MKKTKSRRRGAHWLLAAGVWLGSLPIYLGDWPVRGGDAAPFHVWNLYVNQVVAVCRAPGRLGEPGVLLAVALYSLPAVLHILLSIALADVIIGLADQIRKRTCPPPASAAPEE